MKPVITFDDFAKLDLRIGTIVQVDEVPEADKLLQLTIDLGGEIRTLVAGIREFVSDPSELLNQQIPVLVNLAPREIRGIQSQGMMLAVDVERKPILLHPTEKVPNGSIIR